MSSHDFGHYKNLWVWSYDLMALYKSVYYYYYYYLEAKISASLEARILVSVSVSKFWSHITSLVSCLPSGAVRYFLLTICCTWSAAHANSHAETADDSHGDMCVVALSLSSSSLSLLSTSPSLQTFTTIHFIHVLPLRSFYYWTADLQACKLQQYTISPYWVPKSLSALTPLVGRQEGHPACKKTEW